uniref:Uncharacterized protein n=1 Tax=Magallana gigas TaxID=29159 RepID=A0A8W8KWV1_MAGGI
MDKRIPLQPSYLKNGVFMMQEPINNHSNTLPNERRLNSYIFQPANTTLGSHSAHSRDDDECTTTSGSYTINPDEIDDSFDNRPRDMFV